MLVAPTFDAGYANRSKRADESFMFFDVSIGGDDYRKL
jgi:hypothetical protein